MKKLLTLVISLMLVLTSLFPAGALALTEAEKAQAFSAALGELESYLETPGVPGRSLDACIEMFGGLGKYNYSDSFKRYATALQMIEAGEFSRMLGVSLDSVSVPEFASFIQQLDSVVLCSPEQLISYRNAREAEAAGDFRGAVPIYRECLGFYDSADRYYALNDSICTEAYETGTALFDGGDLAGAYFALQECIGYELTDTVLEMIVGELGYVPESPTDNPCKHEWTEAGCETPRTCVLCGETEGEPLGHKWADASCTKPKTCTICGKTEGEPHGHVFMEATYEAPETCVRCGETRGKPLPKVTVGEYVTFGAYEQDNNLSNGKEPVEWLVLDVQDGIALLISRYGLDAKPYNEKDKSITWEKCTLRKWLNGEFLNACFSAKEQEKIQLSKVDNSSKQQGYGGWNILGGKNTQDKIFLLSYKEANGYFGVKHKNETGADKNIAARVSPTEYAKAMGAPADENRTSEGANAVDYWLRSPGSHQNSAAFICDDGSLSSAKVYSKDGGVRPVFRLVLGTAAAPGKTEESGDAPENGHILMSEPETDRALYEAYRDGKKLPVFGNEKVSRSDITAITFTDTVAGAGKGAWDASADMDGSVLAWLKGTHLYIGADGGVRAPGDSSGLFSYYLGLETIDFDGCFDTSHAVNMSNMFYCPCESELTTIQGYNLFVAKNGSRLKKLDLSGFDTSNVTDMSYMFSQCYELTELDLSGFDTSNVTDMRSMFNVCGGLSRLDLSGFDTSHVTDMSGMFNECINLQQLDVSGWNVSGVKTAEAMFGTCRALTKLDVSGWDTSGMTDMNAMFSGCSGLQQLDVSNFDTSNAELLGGMFFNCSGLQQLDVSAFDTSNATDMNNMFSGCSSLKKLDVSGFDTSNVTDMSYMFSGCSNLKGLDIRGFNISKKTNTEKMLNGCRDVKK